ncbi:MerR family transcriptional regulator [Flavisolibacter ginsenosidimutans]|nr:MerR family transcriptional regulator [Flavisolibacter ginsenosidimutans]
MKNFSIQELARLSGLKAHTLRVWEIRHAVVSPQRGLGNNRYYSVDEMEKLLLLALISHSGQRISTLSQLSLLQLKQRADGLKSEGSRQQKAVHSLIISMYRLDTESFEAVLNDCFLGWPSGTVVKAVIYPFLHKVDLLYRGRRTNEEHLAVTAIRQKLHWSLERLDVVPKKKKAIWLFLPKDTQLDLLLLYLCFVLKETGRRVLYLGADVSIQNLEDLFSGKKADYLLTYLPEKHRFSLPHLSEVMGRFLPQAKLLVVTTNASQAQEPAESNVSQVELDEALSFLNRLE